MDFDSIRSQNDLRPEDTQNHEDSGEAKEEKKVNNERCCHRAFRIVDNSIDNYEKRNANACGAENSPKQTADERRSVYSRIGPDFHRARG
jgi:hypothetical protein